MAEERRCEGRREEEMSWGFCGGGKRRSCKEEEPIRKNKGKELCACYAKRQELLLLFLFRRERRERGEWEWEGRHSQTQTREINQIITRRREGGGE